ncbi:MAG: hypothetical protein Q4G47_06840 [Lachnospiraceae bacterium]|nr:hypothetical protein [Lachnospiraceae bacterium]
MKLDTEALRRDLAAYQELSARLGLKAAASGTDEIEAADDAELVDMAATLGWDFGKYVSE